MDLDEAAKAFREFVAVVRALRTPGSGCPWDLEQTHASLRPYLLEESYEVLDAIDRGDDRSFREELGDLLLQVVLHAQVASDRAAFSITDVVRGITEKMVRRHPHVFGSVRVSDSAEVLRNWEQLKAAERQAGGGATAADPFAGVPRALPALLRAQRLVEKADRIRPDPGSPGDDLAEVRRLLARLEEQVSAGAEPTESRPHLEQALGELLFALCRFARRLGISAEDSLRTSSLRFLEDFGGPPGNPASTPPE